MTPPSATAVRSRPSAPAAPPAPARPVPAMVRAPAVSVRARMHEAEHLLLWQVHGAADLVLDGEIVMLPAGSACWIPAGVVHSLAVRTDSVVLPLLFDAAATRSPPRAARCCRSPRSCARC